MHLTKAARATGFQTATVLFRDPPTVERNLPEQREKKERCLIIVVGKVRHTNQCDRELTCKNRHCTLASHTLQFLEGVACELQRTRAKPRSLASTFNRRLSRNNSSLVPSIIIIILLMLSKLSVKFCGVICTVAYQSYHVKLKHSFSPCYGSVL